MNYHGLYFLITVSNGYCRARYLLAVSLIDVLHQAQRHHLDRDTVGQMSIGELYRRCRFGLCIAEQNAFCVKADDHLLAIGRFDVRRNEFV